MVNAFILIIISCSLVGIFEQLNILSYMKNKIMNVKNRAELFRNTILVSIVTGMVGANQTIAVIMTENIVEKVYDEKKVTEIRTGKRYREFSNSFASNYSVEYSMLPPLHNAGNRKCEIYSLCSLHIFDSSVYLHIL